ncbi:hypothetical protein RQP46_008307 [Phenoliferia psychrophenolica]
MQAVKKIFSHDDEKHSSPPTSGSVGSTGSLAHNPTASSGVASSQTTTGSGVGGNRVGSEASGVGAGSHSTGSHEHSTGKATDGGHGLLSHQHNVGQNAQAPAEGASHDHRHVAAVTKEKLHHHETEEVVREREVDRHVHHVQPVLDTQHADREHSEKVHEPTKIHEQHVNTDSDRQIFAGLNQHKDHVAHGHDSKKVVDKGEVVHENVSHHVHHVVQPVIERDTHTHHTIHTTIPIHQTTHEAPIIHQSSTHEPMHIKDFVKNGGDLKSNLTHDKAGVLADGVCDRKVEGPGEKLTEKLHLGGGAHSGSPAGATASGAGATGVGHGASATTGGTSGIAA